MNAPLIKQRRARPAARLPLQRVDRNGGFEGYASLFHRRDLGGDVVMPGAFAESLRRRSVDGVRMLFQHDPAQPVGVWREIGEDRRGLWVSGQLSLSVQRARELHELMRDGAIDGLSIGFRTQKARKETRAGPRRLLQIDLWEISIVTFPLLPQARIRSVKAVPAVRKS